MGEIDEDKPPEMGQEREEPAGQLPDTQNGDEDLLDWDEWVEPLDLSNVPNRPVGRRRGYRDAYEKSKQRYSSKRRLPSIPESKSPDVAIEAEEALENGEVVTSHEEDDGSHVTRVNISQTYEHSINVDEIDFKMARAAAAATNGDVEQGLGLTRYATQNGTPVYDESSESSEGNSSSPFWDAKRKNRGCRALVVILVIFGISLSSVAVWLAVTTIQQQQAEKKAQEPNPTQSASGAVEAATVTTTKVHYISSLNLLVLPTLNKHLCDVISKYSSTNMCAMYDNVFHSSELSPSYAGCSDVQYTSEIGSVVHSRLDFLDTIHHVASSPIRAIQLTLEEMLGLPAYNLTSNRATDTRTKAFSLLLDDG